MKYSTSIIATGLLINEVMQVALGCQDAAVFNLCMKDQQANVNNCAAADYACLCQFQQAVLSCYNNCNDSQSASQAAIQQGVVASVCNAASQVSSASMATLQTTSLTTSNTLKNPIPTMSLHPAPKPGNYSGEGGSSNGTTNKGAGSGAPNGKPVVMPSKSANGNVLSEGSHILSTGSAAVFLVTATLCFII
ncbi:hypothetical protein INT43_005567 [Umbelopsis isabellina]|uniref:Extracellular membrane protein CFEM domain-containing protein n=1 Tax=Mortierella isabellina TaxID=91625 RepID=A0A8H7UDW5_MORIS|nr:hypothetical protein INT43_005567 [Umbelopsis isabellina]